MNNEKLKITLALGTGLMVGGLIGYAIAEKHVRKQAEDEIADARRVFNKLREAAVEEAQEQARKDWSGPEDDEGDVEEDAPDITVADLHEAARTLSYAPPSGPRPDPRPDVSEIIREITEEQEVKSVYDPRKDPTQYNRDPNYPYVISQEEFMQDEENYSKLSVKYYDKDSSLVDDRDQYIPNTDSIVGESNMELFGVGTESPDLVYVRNDRLESDFEVERIHANYSIDVLGFEPDEDIGRIALAKQAENEKRGG
jgi:hypothetical protein